MKMDGLHRRASRGRRQLHYREERLERFRRCCRFRSFHLAFWLLLSFARDALVHLNAIGRSVAAAVSERPSPPTEARWAGTCHDGRAASHGQLNNAAFVARLAAPPIEKEKKKAPGGPGLQVVSNKKEKPKGMSL